MTTSPIPADAPAAVDPEAALRLHLLSAHALSNAFDVDDPQDAHHYDHTGPCGIRNHPIDARHFDMVKVADALVEAAHNP